MVMASKIVPTYVALFQTYAKRGEDAFFLYFDRTRFTIYIRVDEREIGRGVYRADLRSIARIQQWVAKGSRILARARTQSAMWQRRLGASPTLARLCSAYQEFAKEFAAVSPFLSLSCWYGIEAWQHDFDARLTAMIVRSHRESDREAIVSSVYRPWKTTAVHEIHGKLARGASPEALCAVYQFLRSWSPVWYEPLTVEWIASMGGGRAAAHTTYSRRQLIRMLQPTREEERWLALAPHMVFFKDWRDELRRRHVYCWSFLFDQMAKFFSVPRHDLGLYTLDELAHTLQTGHLDPGVVRRRNAHPCVVMIQKGTLVVRDQSVPKKYQRILDRIAAEREKTIQGLVAHTGVVRGSVVVLKTVADIARVRAGDILVANTTHPNYLPAMKKAAAFVTNEGGMISHAAIIARELGKPCIVGTKTATDVLRDGERVEVDAENGVVRRLS